MKNMKSILAATGLAVAFGMGPSALAESGSLVPTEVDISIVKNDIAKKINVDVSRIPEIVAAPIEVAAKVCNLPAATLRQQVKNESGGCTAETTSAALEEIVQQRIKSREQQ